jgi:hypothetical protein
MAPELMCRTVLDEGFALASATEKVAWMNQATRRHCRFGPKSAPQHRDFGPGKEGVF